MRLILNLSSEQEAQLRELAASVGVDVQSVVLDAVREKLDEEKHGASDTELSYEEWQKEFDAWIGNQRSRNPHMDDSRDSIYD